MVELLACGESAIVYTKHCIVQSMEVAELTMMLLVEDIAASS
jgi:hypothetical protein